MSDKATAMCPICDEYNIGRERVAALENYDTLLSLAEEMAEKAEAFRNYPSSRYALERLEAALSNFQKWRDGQDG